MTQRDSGGRTVLHYAVKNNRRDLVEYLVGKLNYFEIANLYLFISK